MERFFAEPRGVWNVSGNMAAIPSVPVIPSLSIPVTRVAAVARTHTGLSRDAAGFQARSASTGLLPVYGRADELREDPA